MNLYFLSEDSLKTLKETFEENIDNYSSSNNQWVYECFGNISPFIEFKKEVPEFKLKMSCDKPEETDVDNSIILYKNLMDLNDMQASDERLWAGLAHGIFYEYMQYRWSNQKKVSKTNIYARYFFAHSKRRSLITNSISRLWWLGKYTYDDSFEDPFILMDYFKTDFITKSLYLFSSNFSSNEKIRKALLITINNFEKNGVKINRNVFKESIRYLNILGGTYLLDYFSKQELIKKIEDYLKLLLNKVI
ncbi:DUF6339 family protein [Clostridium autoethanogenum]|uniref:DUF6339 family protein n=1 Tax=Clostridium autoethanogenum DSM 10061 TaxID=1341692 RepID=A0ABM5NSG2_9CLOT|nr:DUF6339 family protein [Clostridium autoethanogenum]AGY75242.1 DUF6339 family protein [Clostridium autoethanogenum DSM 10061]ALU35411.1 Hypothetical protein CLAU_0982 [Clostridium autoethanogenum DSM 10061]OVY49510.1 hypothetical protein WX72_03435 [Clostridium autoethanogenum]